MTTGEKQRSQARLQGRGEGGKWGTLPTLDASATLRIPRSSGVQVTVSVTSGLYLPKGASQSLRSTSPPGGHVEKCMTPRKSDHRVFKFRSGWRESYMFARQPLHSTACATLGFPTMPCLPSTLHTYVCVATADGFFTLSSFLTASL